MNFKLFKELKKAADQQNDFHVEKVTDNNLKLMNDLYELEDKGLIELKSNYFAEKYSCMLAVVAKGKITKTLNLIHTSKS
jgi:hypothetical protein